MEHGVVRMQSGFERPDTIEHVFRDLDGADVLSRDLCGDVVELQVVKWRGHFDSGTALGCSQIVEYFTTEQYRVGIRHVRDQPLTVNPFKRP